MKRSRKIAGEYGIDRVIWGNMRRYQYLNKIDNEQFAEMLGVSARMLYYYDKSSQSVNMGRLRRFIERTGTDISEMIEL
jgi:hypothetical protein